MKQSSVEESDFDNIVDIYGKKIFTYCFNMLRNRQEAEDAVQEVFIKAYKKYSSFENPDLIQAWLYKISYNHCLNIIRRKKLLPSYLF